MPLFFVSLPFLIHFPLRMGGGGHGVRPNIISIHVYLYFVPFSLVQPQNFRELEEEVSLLFVCA